MTYTNYKELSETQQEKLMESLRGLPFQQCNMRVALEEVDPLICTDASLPFISFEDVEAFFVCIIKTIPSYHPARRILKVTQ